MTLELAAEDICSKDGTWRDAALALPDGSVYEHSFSNEGLASIVRRVILTPCDTDKDVVYASEISVFTSGRHHRESVGFSVYWHSHSDIIFAMTGITHCTKIYIECGKRVKHDSVLYAKPKIYLVKSTSAKRLSPSKIVWPSTNDAIVWPNDVDIKIVKRVNPSLRILKIHNNLNSIEAVGDVNKCNLVSVNVLSGDCKRIDAKNTEYYFNAELPLFIEKISIAYQRLESTTLSITARILLDNCHTIAKDKKMFYAQNNMMQNFFLANVCLYILGEDNVAEEIIGVLYSRATEPDYGFRKHKAVLRNAYEIAGVLNSLHKNQHNIPQVDDRGNPETDTFHIVKRYYSVHLNVNSATLYMGSLFLSKFFKCWCIAESFQGLQLPFQMLGDVTHNDVVTLLKI